MNKTDTIEGYFSIVKRGIYDVYPLVSKARLHRHLSEFDFRYSNRIKLGIDDVAHTDRAVMGIAGERLTYRTTSCLRGPQRLPLKPRPEHICRRGSLIVDPGKPELPLADGSDSR